MSLGDPISFVFVHFQSGLSDGEPFEQAPGELLWSWFRQHRAKWPVFQTVRIIQLTHAVGQVQKVLKDVEEVIGRYIVGTRDPDPSSC